MSTHDFWVSLPHTCAVSFLFSKDFNQKSSFFDTGILLLIHIYRYEDPLWNPVESRKVFNAMWILHLTLPDSILYMPLTILQFIVDVFHC